MEEGLKGLGNGSKVGTCQQIVLEDYSKLNFVKYWKRQTCDSVFCGMLGHAASCRAEDPVFCCG